MAFFRLSALFAIVALVSAQTPRPSLDEYKASKAAEAADKDASAATAKKGGAVDKAIAMLESLQEQVLAEGEAEAATYNKFSCFCKDTTSDKAKAIEEGSDEKSSLTAEIGDLQSDRDGLDTSIQKKQDDIKKAEDEIAEESDRRAKYKKEFDANSADMKAALVALENAIKTLKASKTPSLLQVQSVSETIRTAVLLADALGLAPKRNQKVFAALLQDPSNGNEVPMEDYKFHSNDIIETLEGLQKDFTAERDSVDEAEVKDKKEHDLLVQEKDNFVKQTTKAMEAEQAEREKKITAIQTASKELSTVEATLLDDQEYMMKLSQMCHDKAVTWDQRKRVRADELATLTQAIGIISTTVKEKTSAATVRFAQTGVSVRLAKFIARQPESMEAVEAEAEEADEATSFVQKRMLLSVHRAASPGDGRQMVADLLANKGKELKSPVLSALASQITSAKGDPFAKIKTLIQELIERLLQEAAAEANQKGWCDKAMSDASQRRDYAAEEISALNADMAKFEATRDQLTEDLGKLAEQIGELKSSRKQAQDDRDAEKAQNNATVIEAQEGLDALEMCMTILDRFYKTVKQETVDLSLVQKGPMDDAPDAGFKNGEAYTGAQGASGGIMGMLEVMKSDFTRTISETNKAEAEAEQDHLEFLTETGKSLAEKEQAHKEKSTQKDDAEEKLGEADEDLESETSKLKTALSELMELKPTCIDTGMSYEERVSRREEEIEALKKADCILGAFAEYGPEGAAGAC